MRSYSEIVFSLCFSNSKKRFIIQEASALLLCVDSVESSPQFSPLLPAHRSSIYPDDLQFRDFSLDVFPMTLGICPSNTNHEEALIKPGPVARILNHRPGNSLDTLPLPLDV